MPCFENTTRCLAPLAFLFLTLLPKNTKRCLAPLAFLFLTLSPMDATWAQDTLPPAESQDAAEDAATPKDRQDLEIIHSEILVTASAPELVTGESFTGEQVRRTVDVDLADFFQSFAGGDAVRRGSVNLDPAIRGLTETQVGMFVDGTRTFAAGPARMDSDISHVPVGSVQRLEVVKGPYALAWGAGSLSALRLETWRPDFRTTGGLRWHSRLSGGYGDNGERADGSAGVWASGERFRFFVDVGHRTGEDYEAGDGSVVPGDFESTEGRWRFGWKPAEAWTLDYTGGYQEQQDLDFPGRLLDATYFYTRSHGVDLEWQSGSRLFQGKVYTNRKDHLMNNDEKPTGRDMPGRMPPFALDVDLGTESNTRGGRLSWQQQQGDWQLEVGADYYHVRQNAERTVARRSNGFVIFRDIVWPDATQEDLGVFGRGVYRGNGFSLSATVRADQVDVEARELSDFFLANVAGAANNSTQDESHVSAALSARFDLGKHWTLSAGIGRALRTATILERYSDRFPSTRFQISAEVLGNPLLDPEASLEVDLGLQGTFGDFLVNVEVFQRTIDDVITFVADPTVPLRLPLSPPVVYRYINGSRAEYLGGELSLRQRIGSQWAWRASVAWLEGDDEELDEPMVGIPPTHGEAGLRWTSSGGNWWIDGAVNFADRQDRVAVQRFEQETPGWTTFDLAVQWQATDSLSLGVAVENLTDRAYARHLDSPNPFTRQRILQTGRDVSLRLQWRM